jgi:superfamily II DNA/RNA helicase
MKCEDGKKLTLIQNIFEISETIRTLIYVNTRDFAIKVQEHLKNLGFKSSIMSSRMTEEERHDSIEKFRRVQINVLIITNLIERNIMIPQP